MKSHPHRTLVSAALGLAAWLAASAARADVVISIDELGTGFLFDTVSKVGSKLLVTQDPTSTIPGPLTYDLTNNIAWRGGIPSPGVIGLFDGSDTTTMNDLIQFTADGKIIFYSRADDVDDPTTLADDWPFPTNLSPSLMIKEKFGDDASEDGLFGYVPKDATDPGFVAGPVGPGYYTFLSDGALTIPEPDPMILAGVVALGLAARGCRRSGPLTTRRASPW